MKEEEENRGQRNKPIGTRKYESVLQGKVVDLKDVESGRRQQRNDTQQKSSKSCTRHSK